MYRGGGGYSLIEAVQISSAPKGRVFRCFGLKRAVDFVHFGLESGMVFEETTGVYERIYRFNSN